MREQKASVPSLVDFLSNLSHSQQVVLTDNRNRQRVVKLLDDLIAEESANTFFTAINDPDVPAKYADMVAKWRKLAMVLGYNGPVVWQVKLGFTFKHHAPKAGPCWQDWDYLQDWKLHYDASTIDSLVFFIPRIVGTNRSTQGQVELLATFRQQYDLPANHLTSFGSVALLAGLVLANFKRNGERVPLYSCRVRTDTFNAVDGTRLLLKFGESGLFCEPHRGWDDKGYEYIGIFPLGVEPIQTASGTQDRSHSSVVAGDYE